MLVIGAVLALVLGGCGGDDVDIGDAERFRQDAYLGDSVDIDGIDTDCAEDIDCEPAVEIGGIAFTVTDTRGSADGPVLRTDDDTAAKVRIIDGVDPARWLIVDTADGPRVAVSELVDRTDPAFAAGPVPWPDGAPVPLAPPTPRQPPYGPAVPAETAEGLRTAVLTGDLPVDYDPEGWPCDSGDCALSFTVGGVVYGTFGVIDVPEPPGPFVTDTPHGTVHAIPGVDPAWILALDDPDFGPIGMLSTLAERAGVQILTPLDTGPVRATLTDDNGGSTTTVELTYTGDHAEQRGSCWTIEHWDTDPGIWADPHHVLAAPADDPPPSNPGPVPTTELHECPAEALTGPGPDHIRLPAGFLRPGTHRICATISEPGVCATFRVG